MAGFQFRAAGGLGVALIAGRAAQATAFFVMARILDEANMGVVSVLTIIYTALFQLTNFGFERYVVYNQSEDEESLTAAINAVWSLQLIRILIILVATAVLSLVLERSEYYDLGFAHLTAIGLAAILMSSISPDLLTHERSGNFAFIARARSYSALIGAAATIGVVLVWATPWAFVVGQILTAAVFMAQSFIYSSRMPQISYSGTDIRKAFKYCKHLLVIAVVSFVSTQVQNIYVGALFSPAVLGVYFTWYRLVNLPRELVTQYATRLLFAKASADSRSGSGLMSSHLRGFAFTVVALLPFHIFVWFHGDFLITFVAGERWASFWWGGQLMAVASILLALSATIGPYNLVYLPHISSTLRTCEAVATTLLMFVFGGPFGLSGVLYSVIAVMAVAMLIRVYLLYTQFVTQKRWDHARAMMLTLVVTAAPLALVEVIVRLYLPESTQSVWAGATYLVVNAAMFVYTVRRGGRLIRGMK
ncbi:oligosaccharide flippase family protein [Rhodovulum sulfidophilum]|uniref:oligosaccharide flippase family protein n=1 Tax=Rhodovulum sulfidophilum TaxID=35806 RepID=UPI001A427F37|nr:oligosaccharide flippase family protein [Rhodovulum sulfidophilum]MBL3587374.1 oligosaccharide flippase family protein [Rhodovulum sulfidophilum]